jgi:hypothetical protein
MAERKSPQRVHVCISDEDRIELARLLRKLQGMKEAPLTKALLHYGIRNAPLAISNLLSNDDEDSLPRGEAAPPGI